MSHYQGKREGEIFVGNVKTVRGIPAYLSDLKTARLGEQALDIDGGKLDTGYMLPLFINQNEQNIYNRIMIRHTFPNQRI